jgi:hypothetical protein
MNCSYSCRDLNVNAGLKTSKAGRVKGTEEPRMKRTKSREFSYKLA